VFGRLFIEGDQYALKAFIRDEKKTLAKFMGDS
jgi:hypothetical protein